MKPEDETAISEITILPDGRICVFGASQQLIHILNDLNPNDEAMRQRIEQPATGQEAAKNFARAGNQDHERTEQQG